MIKHRDIKLATTERRRNYLASEPSYHATKFTGNGNEKTEMHMNKPAYLGLSILELSKILMWEFCYDYVKPIYDEKKQLNFKTK